MSDAHPADGLVWPRDEYPQDWHDDGQAAHQLALERQERATNLLREIYAVSQWRQFTNLSENDVRFLCAELGLDWNDITRR